MNNIQLKGIIDDIQFSHKVGEVEYNKANITVKNSNGKDSILSLIFKKFSNTYSNRDEVTIQGNVRSYSHEVGGKNKVDLYVFTYFNEPENLQVTTDEQGNEEPISNTLEIDGRICAMKELRTLTNGKNNVQFILANNIIKDRTKLSNYLPCIAWGRLAKEMSQLTVNTPIKIYGELRSREYKKYISAEDFELRVAHELLVTGYEVLSEDER